MSELESTIDFLQQRLDRISSKRKLDDYGPGDEDFSDLLFVRTKKDELDAVNSTEASIDDGDGDDDDDVEIASTENDLGARVSDAQSTSCSSGSMEASSRSLHFFVRMISGGNTLVIHANSEDLVESVHEQIRRMTGIPIAEQRLIYRGKQLQCEQTLGECSIQNDAGLQLVGRMRSTEYPGAWQLVNDLISTICRLCRRESDHSLKLVQARVKAFLKMTASECEGLEVENRAMDKRTSGHMQIFKSAGVPNALVMLFLSPLPGNKECAEESVRLFLNPNIEFLIRPIQLQCVPVILEFCKLLSTNANESALHIACRTTLMSLFETSEAVGLTYFGYGEKSVLIREVFPFVCQLATRLMIGLQSTIDSPLTARTSVGDVQDFSVFLLPLLRAIETPLSNKVHLPICLNDKNLGYGLEIGALHVMFLELLLKIDECLKRVDEVLAAKDAEEIETSRRWWHPYLATLKELYNISKLYKGSEEKLISALKPRRAALNAIIKYAAKRSDDHRWILEHKDLTDFESRRHLVMMLLPDVKDDYEDLYEMLIDRSQLLAESFEYIANADPDSLHGGLFMEFKNEEATGPGVLREWFCLVCQAIFDQQNALFLACPNDHRRFFPNPAYPASNVEPLHLKYFGFCGRVIALALMHKVQVGIVFDRIFFLQLAGKFVSLEDVRDADPCLYMSCKRILEMDAEFLDSDGLGLTFVREVDKCGSRETVELCPGGKGIVLNSKNREAYVKLLIQHHFMTSVSDQVAHFAQGFTDILRNSTVKFFFESLDLEDLDRMLYGSDRDICVKDWKAHTEYYGYKETDDHIYWFWKIVEDMSVEQRRVLLFFWTSVKYLPTEGFGGLQSRLYIYKAADGHDRLPSSHTCFYRICLPAYPSQTVMRECLQIVTQEHVSCSFGIW